MSTLKDYGVSINWGNFWAFEGGKDWTNRNAGRCDIEGRAGAFKKLIGDLPIKSILEVGCNAGHNLTAFSKIGDYRLVGIDISKYAIEGAEVDCPAELIVADAFSIPFEDRMFDLVFTACFFCVYPYEGMSMLAEEVSRVSNKYILIIEYPMFDGCKKELDANVNCRGLPLFWMRDYHDDFFPEHRLIRRGERDPALAGFEDKSMNWWLFERCADEIRT